jgi:fluoroquinolone transport system permease protein
LALEVTPLPLGHYVLYRIAAPMLISLLITPLALLIAGVTQLPLWALLVATLSAVPLAPLTALLLASFANNKVQGLALMKGLSVFLVAPLLAHWTPQPWQSVFGLLPTYWPARLYSALLEQAPYAWLPLVAAFVLDGVLIWLLLRRFERVVHR